MKKLHPYLISSLYVIFGSMFLVLSIKSYSIYILMSYIFGIASITCWITSIMLLKFLNEESDKKQSCKGNSKITFIDDIFRGETDSFVIGVINLIIVFAEIILWYFFPEAKELVIGLSIVFGCASIYHFSIWKISVMKLDQMGRERIIKETQEVDISLYIK